MTGQNFEKLKRETFLFSKNPSRSMSYSDWSKTYPRVKTVIWTLPTCFTLGQHLQQSHCATCNELLLESRCFLIKFLKNLLQFLDHFCSAQIEVSVALIAIINLKKKQVQPFCVICSLALRFTLHSVSCYQMLVPECFYSFIFSKCHWHSRMWLGECDGVNVRHVL